LRFTLPVRLASPVTLMAHASLEADDLSIEREGLMFRDDRLRVFELGTRASWRSGTKTQYLATFELRQGLDTLGGGLRADDLAIDRRRADFVLARLQFVRLMRLDEAWSLRFDGLLQHSGYVLPYNERFKIGGDRLGRGFEVAEIAGDQGIGGKLELRRELPWNGETFGRASAYTFYDHGVTWKQDVSGSESAGTAGLGLGLRGGDVSGYLEVAMPVGDPDIEGKTGAAIFAEISYRF
jgi:hemolysin activation/secretion protein